MLNTILLIIALPALLALGVWLIDVTEIMGGFMLKVAGAVLAFVAILAIPHGLAYLSTTLVKSQDAKDIIWVVVVLSFAGLSVWFTKYIDKKTIS